MEYILAITTCPENIAEDLAVKLVQERVCACVNIVRGVTSVYRWQGSVEIDPECLLLIKTTRNLQDELWNVIREKHPYDVPEFVVLDITNGSTDYLDWIASSVG